ncbi:hypothetical protein ACNO7P_11030, partial [Bisgaard Taxon 45]
MLYAVEQEYIPMRSFMENFKSQYQKDISLDELITLFLNDKIYFYIHIIGDQNKIFLSKKENVYYNKEEFEIFFYFSKYRKKAEYRYEYREWGKTKIDKEHRIISNIKDKTFSYTNKDLNIHASFENALYSREYHPFLRKYKKEILINLENIFIDGYFRIYKPLDPEIFCKNEMFNLVKTMFS